MSDLTPSTPPQFGTAEYESPGPDHCKFCNQPVGTQYYRVGDATACGSCAARLRNEMPVETAGVYARSVLFGIGAAIVGMALYAMVTIITGWEIGFVSLAVGWIVGKSVLKGARGFGGRKYQFTAVALTYAAVSVAAVPIGLSQMWKSGGLQQTKVEGAQTSGAAKTDAAPDGQTPAEKTPEKAPPEDDDPDTDTDAAKSETAATPGAGEKPMGLGVALLTLLLVGLASPFLALANPGQGLIGLVILFVGLHIAWQSTAATALVVEGPFTGAPSNAAGAGS